MAVVLTSIQRYLVLAMPLPRFNFPDETFLRIGPKVAKACSCEKFLRVIDRAIKKESDFHFDSFFLIL